MQWFEDYIEKRKKTDYSKHETIQTTQTSKNKNNQIIKMGGKKNCMGISDDKRAKTHTRKHDMGKKVQY